MLEEKEMREESMDLDYERDAADAATVVNENKFETLSVVANRGDLHFKQLLHRKLKNHIEDKKLFLMFHKKYNVKLNGFIDYIVSKFSSMGNFYRYIFEWRESLNIFMMNNYIISFETDDDTYRETTEIFLKVYVSSIKFKNKIFKMIDEIMEPYLVDFVEVNIDFWYKIGPNLTHANFNSPYTPELPNVNYPFMIDLNKYINSYLESKSPILILIGDPGTGKTRFIRNLLSISAEKSPYKRRSVYFTVDPTVLEESAFFVDYMSSDSRFLVVEDMDQKLDSRKEGNDVMYQLLNVSDGLVDMSHKKMIFSTNLPHINNIEPALLRDGRCYEILKFRKLTKTESYNFLHKNEKYNIKLYKQEYTLAELYSILNNGYDDYNKKILRTGFTT